MIKLKSLLNKQLLLTESSEPTDSDQWDNWYEYINYFEYELEASELKKLIEKYDLSGKSFFNGKIIRLSDKIHTIYLDYDRKNSTADWIKDIDQWVYDINDSEYNGLNINPDTLYNSHVESSLDDVRKSPGIVYHYTTEDKWDDIQASGKLIGSYGTGINNRYAYGIFTSTDPEEYASGTYGNICLQIDLTKFKQENNLSKLNLEFEPEVLDYLVREYIRSTLELESREELPSDMSPYTIIVNHVIPLKYVTIYEP